MQYATMGEMIASLRRERGMTQKDLAQQLHVTDQAVSKWERNVSCPDIHLLGQLSALLGVSADELLLSRGETAAPKQAPPLVPLILSAVPLAMGVAVAALHLLGQLNAEAAVPMLAVGMVCLGLRGLVAKGE